MPSSERSERPNQKARTRKDLLRAAARLMKQGRKPSLEEVAEEALVSRATAYRYFVGVESLLLEASLDVVIPEVDDLFNAGSSEDPVTRLEQVDSALHEMIVANEAQLRIMLARSLERGVRGEQDADLPPRQNRRTPLIEAALEPGREQFDPDALETLKRALALLIGPEAMVVCKDVLQIDDQESRKVKQWAIRALIAAARRPGQGK